MCERRTDGITHTLGDSQVAWAVLASYEAVKLSGRRDAAVKAALKHRVEQLWSFAVMALLKRRRFGMAARVAWVGLRIAPTFTALKRLYWSAGAVHRQARPRPVAARQESKGGACA
jgi:hypothetical protein